MSRGLTRGYDPSLPYNLVPNAWMEGAVAGTPGTAPTGWTVSAVSGWSRQVVGTGFEDGIPYIDLRLFSAGGSSNNYRFNVIPARDYLAGEQWTFAAYHRLIAGSFSGFTARTFIAAGVASHAAPTSAPLIAQPIAQTRTIPSTINSYLAYGLLTPASGDVTVRLGFPTFVGGAVALPSLVPIGRLLDRRHGLTTYGLTGALAASLGERVVRSVAVALDFPSGIARWNSSPSDIVIGGQTFLGVGALGTISAAEEGIELRAYGMTVGVTGIPRDAVALALGQAYQGRAGTVWEVMLDATTWQPLADPIVIFRGRMDQMDVTLGATAEVQVKLENRLTDWERPKIVRYTDSDQRRRDPNDGSFRFLPATTEKEIIWPARSFRG